MTKRALICGVSGQDGAYLAKLLLEKGYEVWGTSRDAQAERFGNLMRIGIAGDVRPMSVVLNDFRSVLQALVRSRPDEIYNLAGQSSVGLSYEQPVETMESISVATTNLLEAIRFTASGARLYAAGSSECFGDTDAPADETTPFRPRSPYAVAKAAAFWQVSNYREAYELWACSGILFNHESPLRPARFVTRKICAAAAAISRGARFRLRLGNVRVVRDWGWAPEYVDAMWRMLQAEKPDDYVIATGSSASLEKLAETAFAVVGLDARDHVDIDPSLFRPLDLSCGRANPAKAREKLGWRATIGMEEVVRRMVEAELSSKPEAESVLRAG